MQGRMAGGWWSRGVAAATSGIPSSVTSSSRKQQQLRLMVTKAANRAAVHGTRLPVPDQINKEEVEDVVSKAKQEKEEKWKDVEKIVDSEIKKSDKPYSLVE